MLGVGFVIVIEQTCRTECETETVTEIESETETDQFMIENTT